MFTEALDLTKGSVFRGLLKVALPLMGTSFVQMSYTLMAMMWVGHLGSRTEAAIGAIGMILWLTSSVTLLALIGAEVSVGQSIGAGKMKRARTFASHATLVSIIVGLCWNVLLFSCSYPILGFFHLPADITSEAATYLRILTICIPFQFLSFNFSGICNGAGRSDIPFKINTIGLALNMILDPVLIFWCGLGFYGAAIGTVVAQLVVFSMFTFKMRAHRSVIGRFPFFIKPKAVYLKKIFMLGTPVSIMNSFYAIINATLARAASIYGGHIGLMTQTTGGQIEGVTWHTAQGFSTALSAYMAQNYAANKPGRGTLAYKYALQIMLSLGVVVGIVFMLFGDIIFGIIVPEREAMRAGGEYLFIVGLVQVFMMLELTTQGMFNGIGRTVEPAVISITFNLLRIPMAYLFASQYGVVGVWWAISLSSVCKGIILPVMFMFVYKKKVKNKKR